MSERINSEDMVLPPFEVWTVAEGIAAYIRDRQAGTEERHQLSGLPPWRIARLGWAKNILWGMAARCSEEISAKALWKYLSKQAKQVRGGQTVELSASRVRCRTIQILDRYAAVLTQSRDDYRCHLWTVKDLLEDMYLDRLWWSTPGLSDLQDEVQSALLRITAQQPIRFTRILLGPERGPCDSALVAGIVNTVEAVRQTGFYREMCGKYPKMREWPSICVAYGGGGRIPVCDTSEFDLSILWEAGDRALDLEGIHPISGCYELRVSKEPDLTMADRYGWSHSPALTINRIALSLLLGFRGNLCSLW